MSTHTTEQTKRTEKSVLIIDDDSFIGTMIAKLLQTEGYAIRRVTTGEEGLVELEKQQPTLVLLDIGLPGIDGYEVLKRIDGDVNFQGTHVLVLSNFGQAEEIERSKRLGAIDHLVKANVDPKTIVSKIKSLCGDEL